MRRTGWLILWLGCCAVPLPAADIVDNPEENVFGLPHAAMERGGTLVLHGGGEHIDDVCNEFVRIAGGKQARLVLIPSAYPFDDEESYSEAYAGWKNYDVTSLDFLHTDDPDEADDPEFCKILEVATGVWIGGGAQARLTYRYGGRRVEQLLRTVLERGGAVGGTSAGASVVSGLMIRDGSATLAATDRGFGLAQRLVVDQHFSERGRFPRLLGVLEDHPRYFGIGLDEDTGIVLSGNELRVIGKGRVAVCVGPTTTRGGVTVHRLEDGEEAELVISRPSARRVTFDLKRGQGK
jgi:cyanophycinase